MRCAPDGNASGSAVCAAIEKARVCHVVAMVEEPIE